MAETGDRHTHDDDDHKAEVVVSAGAQKSTRNVDWSRIQPEGDYKAVLITKSDLEPYYGGALPDSAILSKKDSPEWSKLKDALSAMAKGMSSDPETISALSEPDLLEYLVTDSEGAYKASPDSKICAVVLSDEPSTLGRDFNRFAQLAPGVNPDLGPLANQSDPGFVLRHELEHCGQDHKHGQSNFVRLNAVLDNEYGADKAGNDAFPELASLNNDARSIGAIHSGLSMGDNFHPTSQRSQLGGEHNYFILDGAYKEIGQEIGRARMPEVLSNLSDNLRQDLAYALESAVKDTDGEWLDRSVAEGSDAARYRDVHQGIINGTLSGSEAMASLPDPVRANVESNFANAIAIATPGDPNIITPLLRQVQSNWAATGKHDPNDVNDPVSAGVKLYIEASERRFPAVAQEREATRSSIQVSLPKLDEPESISPVVPRRISQPSNGL